MPALAGNSSNARLALPLFLEFIVAHSTDWSWIESSDRRIRNTDKSFSSVKIKQDPSKLKMGFYSFKPIWLQWPSLETVSKKKHFFANGEVFFLTYFLIGESQHLSALEKPLIYGIPP